MTKSLSFIKTFMALAFILSTSEALRADAATVMLTAEEAAELATASGALCSYCCKHSPVCPSCKC